LRSIKTGFKYLGIVTILFLVTGGVFFVARYPSDKDSLKVFYHAGSNIFELLKSLDHYKIDPDLRKYEAAKFLIRHLDLHPHYEDPYSDQKMQWFVTRFESTRSGFRKLDDSLEIAWSDTRMNTNRRKIRDARVLSSELLIRHIDKAFEIWDESPWKNHFTFNDFCEYFLPYKSDESKPEYWFEDYHQKYSSIIEQASEDAELPELIQRIYDEADSAAGWHHLQIRRNMTPSEKEKILSGDCRYRSEWFGLILRSQGLPVANVYSPDEANTVGRIHYWNVWRDPSGKWHEIVRRDRVV
jgi:hypothetical protein